MKGLDTVTTWLIGFEGEGSTPQRYTVSIESALPLVSNTGRDLWNEADSIASRFTVPVCSAGFCKAGAAQRIDCYQAKMYRSYRHGKDCDDV